MGVKIISFVLWMKDELFDLFIFSLFIYVPSKLIIGKSDEYINQHHKTVKNE